MKSIGECAFKYCSKLEDVYCYAEKVPSTDASAFEGSYIEYSTLHVPGSSLSLYQATAPWSGFGTIKALGGTEPEPETKISPCNDSILVKMPLSNHRFFKFLALL